MKFIRRYIKENSDLLIFYGGIIAGLIIAIPLLIVDNNSKIKCNNLGGFYVNSQCIDLNIKTIPMDN